MTTKAPVKTPITVGGMISRLWSKYFQEIDAAVNSGIGAQGPQGAQGSAGAQGADGSAGAQGPQGESGAQAAFEDLTDVDITSPSLGDIVYFDGSNWVKLDAGVAGQYLISGGSVSAPYWGGGSVLACYAYETVPTPPELGSIDTSVSAITPVGIPITGLTIPDIPSVVVSTLVT